MSLRVLQIVPYFYPAWAYGGIPRLAYGLSRALQERGHRVTVVTTDALDRGRRLRAGRTDLEGLVVHRLPNLSNRLAYDHQLFLPRGASALLDAQVARADVVHLHGWWHLLNNVASSAAARCGVPVVHTPNGTLPALERKLLVKGLWDRALGRPGRRRVERWIAVSRAELTQLRAGGVAADAIDLIYNGIDLGEFESLPPRGSFRSARGIAGPLVLYLGKLTPRKGVDHLIDALARMDRRDAVLVVAGNDMGVLAGLRAQVAALGLGERVLFTGLLTGPDRLAALADADVLVYPSEHEIFGLVPFEGLLCGTPAVVSDDCGCGEIVARARAGERVRYGDAAGLADALDSLLADTARRQAMVARGREFIARELAWPHIAARTEDTYRRAMA